MHRERAVVGCPGDVEMAMTQCPQIGFVRHRQVREHDRILGQPSRQMLDQVSAGRRSVDVVRAPSRPVSPLVFGRRRHGRDSRTDGYRRGMQLAKDLVRTVRTIVVGVGVTAFACAAILWLTFRNPDSPKVEKVIRMWARTWLRAADVVLQVRGAEHIDPTQSYVIVSNHRSNLDIPAHFITIPTPLRFLAKTELFAIPVLGTTMRKIGIVEVDRARGAAIHRELNASASDNLRHARSLMVYPEGTRSRDGSMRDFKKGAVAIAIENQMPIVPVTTYGSYRAWPPKKLVKGGTVITVVGKPIETTGLTRVHTGSLTQSIREQIEETFNALDTGVVESAEPGE